MSDHDKAIFGWAAVILVAFTVLARKTVGYVSEKLSHEKFKGVLRPIATAELAPTGLSPLIAVTQAALESGWGSSELTRTGNNLFGMTAGKAWREWKTGKRKIEDVPAWTKIGDGRDVLYRLTKEHSLLAPEKIQYWDFPGDIVKKTPDGQGGTNLDVNRAFRRYDNWGESVRDWARLILTPNFAAAAEAARKNDLNTYADAVKAAGYATDPAYVTLLKQYGDIIKAIPDSRAIA